MTLQPQEAGGWKEGVDLRCNSLALTMQEAVQWPSALEMSDEGGSRDKSVPRRGFCLVSG